MASTIKVDNVQNQPGTNVVNKCGTTVNIGAASDNIRSAGNNLQASDGGNLISQSGTTVTLGASGDTVSLASGASQTGFGRTGTVDWDTTPKTATVTAANGVGYFVDTTSGEVTVNLPAGAAGSIVAIADYANTADTNKIIISANGTEKIQGVASNAFEITVEGGSVTLVYVDSTQGWRPTDASTAASITENDTFITATGGCVTCCGNFKIHTFTGPGTFCVSAGGGPVSKADYLVVAAGGGGTPDLGGGGGAGGYRESPGTASGCYAVSPLGAAPAVALPVSVQGYPITVGGGGTVPLGNGNNSIFSTITSTGGGGGASISNPGNTGGSGGGNGSGRGGAIASAAGNTPPVSPPQGQPGGPSAPTSPTGPADAGSGGGGAGASGSTSNNSGAGGNGVASSINTTPTTRSGGGGGGAFVSQPLNIGGSGGGGRGGQGPGGPPATNGVVGTVNTGGGGGSGGQGGGAGAIGGSGIVIIRYKYK